MCIRDSSTCGKSNASRNEPVRSAVQTSGGRLTGPPSAPRATTAAAASASEGPRMYYGRGATSNIVPTHVFRPRAGAQGAQRDAGGRVRIDDGGSNDLWLLRRSTSSTTRPARRGARAWDPSTARDTPTISGSFSVPETRFFSPTRKRCRRAVFLIRPSRMAMATCARPFRAPKTTPMASRKCRFWLDFL